MARRTRDLALERDATIIQRLSSRQVDRHQTSWDDAPTYLLGVSSFRIDADGRSLNSDGSPDGGPKMPVNDREPPLSEGASQVTPENASEPQAGDGARRPITDRASGIWVWSFAAGLLAGLATWVVGELVWGRVHSAQTPKIIAFPTAADHDRIIRGLVSGTAVTFVQQGAIVGVVLGIASGLIRRSARVGLVAAMLGGALGAAMGTATSYGLLTVHFRNADPQDNSLTLALLVHGGIWASVGAAAGLAFGLGSGGRGRWAAGAFGGLVGGAAAAMAFDVIRGAGFPARQNQSAGLRNPSHPTSRPPLSGVVRRRRRGPGGGGLGATPADGFLISIAAPVPVGRFRRIGRRYPRKPSRTCCTAARPATLECSSGSDFEGVQLLSPSADADVVHPPGDQRLHRALGGRLAALVREERRLVRLHEQRLGRWEGSWRARRPEPGERPAGECGVPPQPEQVDDRGRHVAQAHRLGTTRPAGTPLGSTITSGTWTSCRYRLHPWKNSR